MMGPFPNCDKKDQLFRIPALLTLDSYISKKKSDIHLSHTLLEVTPVKEM